MHPTAAAPIALARSADAEDPSTSLVELVLAACELSEDQMEIGDLLDAALLGADADCELVRI